ncbi:LOW QUALITY PROTEIN: protein transport protein Sec24C [Anguilla anguilla]|uniref:LOW QUALITY PROTEIN: protein transport protein Sec24C n=1 Tax=Anguilla anguilla TaxID=7936 RepID=UPI0015AD5B6F|nr:LOW QUALITY PROTEIN: protein transport protein Sec24C [Anguilla anguilla]
MDIPAANHEQPWGHMGWPAAAPIAGYATAVPNGPPPGLQYPNKGIQNAPPIMGSGHPPGVWPHQKPSWAPPPNHFNGMLCEPNPELSFRSNSQSPQGGSSSQPDSRVLSPSSESRYGLDPQCLPSAVQGMQENREEWEGKVFVSEPGSLLPPLATTGFTVEDRGNASPRFIRCTSYSFPSEGTTAQLSHLPLGAVLTPLARLEKGERPLPVCSGTAEGGLVPGCSGCGAYMCPFMTWQDCGQRFSCPFCGKLTEVPWRCYQPTAGGGGARTASERRPELCLGSYDVLESGTGQAAGLLLALDVSAPALKSGHLGLICQQLRSFLSSLAREEGGNQSDLRVGLMTYDSRLHLYDLSPTLSRPHMLIITDTTELELPTWEGLLVPLKDSRYCIDSLLQQIPRLAEGSEDTPCAQGLPGRAALRILEAVGCPGKVLVFQSAPLTEAALKHGSSGFFNSGKPKTLFQPSEPCVSLAEECANQGCSLHLFLFSQPDVGGAWPGHTPYMTGGGVYCYDGLQSEVDREQLSCDLHRCVETETAFKAQLRVFVSKGLSVSGFYGSFIPGPDPAHVSLAALDWRTTLAVQFTHSSPLEEQRGVVIQAALSYTSAWGERRTRVHSLTLPCSRHLLDTFRTCQAQTLLTFYCKKVYCAVLERPLQEVREELQADVTQLLASYRKHCSSTAVSPGQLVLPQFLKALPVYVNSLRKSEVLLPCVRSTVTQRLHLRSQLLCQDVRTTATHFYPLLLPLPMSSEPLSALSAMEAVRCSASSLDPGSLFLAHCSLSLFLWVGQGVPAHVLLQLFNTTCFSLLPSGQLCLPELQNPLSVTVRKLIHSLQSQAPCALRLQVVKQGDSTEEALQRLLVEDKSPNGGASYADFLYHLHVNSLRLLV